MQNQQDYYDLMNFKIPRTSVANSNNSIPTVDSVLVNCYDSQTLRTTVPSYSAEFVASPPPAHRTLVRKPITAATNTSTTMIYKDTYACNRDPTMPRELTEQFQPLYCKLCAMQLTSSMMARSHYDSKNHEKKVRKFLMDYAERTGEPVHDKLAEISSKRQKKSEVVDAKYFYCPDCDLPLTGKLHAESHYMGRNHRKVVAGKGKPTGLGFYDADGKWIRTSNKSEQGDNFGLLSTQTQPLIGPVEKKQESLFCSLCSVQVTCEVQLLMHQSGQKHQKKLKQLELSNGILDDTALFVSGDLSEYRTPSGQFYCNPCNLSVNSDIQFKQHLNSKRHTKKRVLNLKDQL